MENGSDRFPKRQPIRFDDNDFSLAWAGLQQEFRSGRILHDPLKDETVQYADLEGEDPGDTVAEDERVHVFPSPHAPPEWLARTCWFVHGPTLVRASIRAKWADGAIAPELMAAHDTLMEQVMSVNESTATFKLRQAVKGGNSKTEYLEEPVEVPAHKEKYLDTFRKLFCIIVSRPKLFIFTANQREAFEDMMRRQTHAAVLAFWYSVICHSYDNLAPYRPIEAAIAALNWDEKNGTFRTPASAIQTFAQVALCIRLLLVYYSFILSHLLEDVTPWQVFAQQCRRFVRTTDYPESQTPMGHLLRLWTFAKSLKDESAGSVLEDDGRMTVGTTATTESDIKSGIIRIVEDLERDCVELVGKNIDTIDPSRFVGATFAHCDIDNQLSEWAGGDPIVWMDRLWRKKLSYGETLCTTKCSLLFFERVLRFKEQLLVAMHVTGGSPATCAEIMTLRFTNSSNVRFGLSGCSLVYRNNKSQPEHRLLPEKVGRVLLLYIGVIHPFVMCINQALYEMVVHQGDPDAQPRGLVQSINLFQTEYPQRVLDDLSDDDDEPTGDFEQMCDAVPLEDLWTKERMLEVLSDKMTHYMGGTTGEINVSSWRHCCALLTRQRVKQPELTGAHFHEEQFPDLVPRDRVQDSYDASRAWHRYVGLERTVRGEWDSR